MARSATPAVIPNLLNMLVARRRRSWHDGRSRDRDYRADQKARTDKADHHLFEGVHPVLLHFNDAIIAVCL